MTDRMIFNSKEPALPPMPGPGKTCHRKTCNDAPVWNVGFEFYAPASVPGSHVPATAETSLYLCDKHGREATIADLIPEDGWKFIDATARFAGKCPPDRSRTKIRLLPILNL